MISRIIIISGKVQGVFFRACTLEKANELGLKGWVRNNDDGSVEIHAEGDPEALKKLEEWAHLGPPKAEVESVDVRVIPEENYQTFEVI